MASIPRTPPILDPPIRLAVCASGGGTTLQNLIDRIRHGQLSASIVQIVASRPGIGAIARGNAAGIPVTVATRSGLSLDQFSHAVFTPVRERQADLVILGGFLSLITIPPDYEGKVINIHPALIPAFCGHGFHGDRVHRAVLDRGAKLSGCTVHFADNQYDNGPIISQQAVPVRDDDTPSTLAARVFEAECQALPQAIALYAAGRLHVQARRVLIQPAP